MGLRLKTFALSGIAAVVMSCTVAQPKRVINYDTDHDGTPDVQVAVIDGSYKSIDTDNDGERDLVITVSKGNVNITKYEELKEVWTLNDFGADGVVEQMFKKSYDESDRMTRMEMDFNSDGRPDKVLTREYDAKGRDIGGTLDLDGDGREEEINRVEYLENSTRRTWIRAKSDFEYSETMVEHVGTYRPCLLRSIGNDCLYESGVRMTKDNDGDGCPETTWWREGDTETVVSDYDSDCEPDSIEKMYYDAEGVRTKGEWDHHGDGTPDDVAVYEDKRWTFTDDEDNDGKPDKIAVHLFDDDGIYRKEIDESADGTVDNVWRRGRGWSEE